MFCFCGPAGSGKSSICTELRKTLPDLTLSISTTSRAPRGSEKDGTEYFFVTPEEFSKRVQAKKFIEHAVFNGNHYGTELANIERAAAQGCDLLLDIDVQGAEQLRALAPKQVVVVFLFPPSFSVLEQRFRDRKTDSEDKIQARLKIAREEIRVLSTAGFSDYFLLNDDFKKAASDAASIVQAERCRFWRVSQDKRALIFN